METLLRLFSICRPVRVIRFISEETIEEGIYSIAHEKLRLEQDLTSVDNDGDGSGKVDSTRKAKRDVSRLLKIALDVEMSDKQLGDVGKVLTEVGDKVYTEL